MVRKPIFNVGDVKNLQAPAPVGGLYLAAAFRAGTDYILFQAGAAAPDPDHNHLVSERSPCRSVKSNEGASLRIIQSGAFLPYPRSLPWPSRVFPPRLGSNPALRTFPQFDCVAGFRGLTKTTAARLARRLSADS